MAAIHDLDQGVNLKVRSDDMRQQHTFNDRSGFLIGLVVLTVCLQIVSLGFTVINEIRIQRVANALERFADDLRDL